ncbi:hypothetical protein DFH29DRAFT_1083719 [Suillus ampliporus]|nr:hypothetical protein DFH29DRAFT_1083719 [Suillus ampliporus]
MTGANYMGGKRNAARARTKDSTGRLQKRHFGQQRLAAALCNTREEREKPEKMTLKSVLHQINLAPAQRDAIIKGSFPSTAHTSTSCDQSFTHNTSLDASKRRKQPSKILRALDFSDPVAYRDAIDRILAIPLSEMIGLPLRGESPHADDGNPSFDPEEDLHLPIDDDTESDVQVQGTSSDIFSATSWSSGSTSHLFPLDNNDDLDDGGIYASPLSEGKLQLLSPDDRMVTRHGSPLRAVEADDLHGSCVNDSGYADMDTAETRVLRGSILTPGFLDPQQYPSPPSNSFPFSFSSHSQGTEGYILDIDTSPPSSLGSFECSVPPYASPAPKSNDGWSPNYDTFLQRSPSSSNSPLCSPASNIINNPPEFVGWDSSVRFSSPQCHASGSGSSARFRFIPQSLYHPNDVKSASASPFETQHTPTTPEKGQKIKESPFCAAQTSERAVLNPFHRRPFQPSYPAIRTEPAEACYSTAFNSSHGFSSFSGSDVFDPGLPLDILNDPDPWATIGKILNLATVEEHNNGDIHFTRGREGVGYVRPHLDETIQIWHPQRSSMTSPRSVKSDGEDEPGPKATMNNEVEEHAGENTNNCRYQSQHFEDSKLEERSSPDGYTNSSHVKDTEFPDQNEPLCTSTVAESEMQIEPPCIPATLAHRVSPQVVRYELNDEEMYGGPCLFGDSDEEDE